MENSVYSTYMLGVEKAIIVAAISTLPLNVFRKAGTCPSSHVLLDFTRSRCDAGRREFVSAHLEQCEFCRAELQLLDRVSLQAEHVRLGEIPPKLRLLAESILGKSSTMQTFRLAEVPRLVN